MAYSNWGAKVWRDDVAMHNHCDVTVRQALGIDVMPDTYWRNFLTQDDDPTKRMYHAVVGDQEGGLIVCLYKYAIATAFLCNDTSIEQAQIPYGWIAADPQEGTFQCRGIPVEYESDNEPDNIYVTFTDKAGHRWRGTSGMYMGEGYEDWD